MRGVRLLCGRHPAPQSLPQLPFASTLSACLTQARWQSPAQSCAPHVACAPSCPCPRMPAFACLTVPGAKPPCAPRRVIAVSSAATATSPVHRGSLWTRAVASDGRHIPASTPSAPREQRLGCLDRGYPFGTDLVSLPGLDPGRRVVRWHGPQPPAPVDLEPESHWHPALPHADDQAGPHRQLDLWPLCSGGLSRGSRAASLYLGGITHTTGGGESLDTSGPSVPS